MTKHEENSAVSGVGSTDGLEVSAGSKSLGPILAEALYQRAVGVYHNSLSADVPYFIGISTKRYNEVIRPEIERLVAEVERLTSNAAHEPTATNKQGD
ncbi:MAG: hypothetical protein ACYC1K_03530 [Minisyncoccota bacterium]